jgi:hypothetical protein
VRERERNNIYICCMIKQAIQANQPTTMAKTSRYDHGLAGYPQDELTQELQKLDGKLSLETASFLQEQKKTAYRDKLAQKLREKIWWCEGEEEEEEECDPELDPELDPESEPSEDDEDARLDQLRHRSTINISDEETDERCLLLEMKEIIHGVRRRGRSRSGSSEARARQSSAGSAQDNQVRPGWLVGWLVSSLVGWL